MIKLRWLLELSGECGGISTPAQSRASMSFFLARERETVSATRAREKTWKIPLLTWWGQSFERGILGAFLATTASS